MWIDARRPENGSRLETDVLVFGGGAAGLALTKTLDAVIPRGAPALATGAILKLAMRLAKHLRGAPCDTRC